MIKKFFSICLMFFLMACGGLEKDTGSSLLDKKENVQVKELIALTDELLIDIRQKRIFSSYTPSQQQNVQESLIKIKH